VLIAEAVRFATRKHRARSLFMTVATGVVLGALPAILLNLFLFHNVFGAIFQGVFLFIATPVVYARLSGIQMTR
jgi:hypothetical protein